MSKNLLFIAAVFAAGQAWAVDINSMRASDVASAGAGGVVMPAGPVSRKANTLPQALRKIRVNAADEAMNDALVGLLQPGLDIDWVLRDLASMGFRAKAYTDASGGYFVMVDVKGLDGSDYAIGLARVYYVTEVRVGRAIYAEIFGGGAKSTYAVKQGSIKGGMNGSPADVRIDKLNWTVTGGMNHSPVDLVIDHDARAIKGGANLSPVDLRFDWSKERVLVEGGANNSPVSYVADWEKGELTGRMNNAPLRIVFDMKAGQAGERTVELAGYAGRAPVNLSYDKVSGRLTGAMNRAPVDVTLVNCDLYDFLQYFFLFAGKN
jgi:hypothetical protein